MEGTVRNLRYQDDGERGAILVHVAIGLLALLSFSAFTIDYGVLWASRRMAQNSADAGALAGAIAFANDTTMDKTDSGPAKLNAYAFTQQNRIYGEPPNVVVATDITFPTCPPDAGGGDCIRVDVYRTPDRGNALPMFFGQLFGTLNQGIRATATAQIAGGNMAKCMLPFALSDRWADVFDESVDTSIYPDDGDGDPIVGWSPNDLYQPESGDIYRPPYADDRTGWTVEGDHGRQLSLHRPVGQFSAGWAGIVNLPESVGADEYKEDIYGCNPNYVGIAAEGTDCSTETYDPAGTTIEQAEAGCLGVQTGWVEGPTSQAVSGPGGGPSVTPLTLQDEDAEWSWAANDGKGAVVDGEGNVKTDSPRIRPLAVFHIEDYTGAGCSGSGCMAKVVNIVGFFVEGLCDDLAAAGKLDPGVQCDPDSNASSQVVGRIVKMNADDIGTGGTPVEESAFLTIVRLVR
jgi:hypothetical protein